MVNENTENADGKEICSPVVCGNVKAYIFSGITVRDPVKGFSQEIKGLSTRQDWSSDSYSSSTMSEIFGSGGYFNPGDITYTETCKDVPQESRGLYEALGSMEEVDNKGQGPSVKKLINIIIPNYKDLNLNTESPLLIEKVNYVEENRRTKNPFLSTSWAEFLELGKPYLLGKQIERKTRLMKINKGKIEQIKKG